MSRRLLWRDAGIAALVCGSLGACASSPAYPIDEHEAPGSRPLAMARPQYSIDDRTPQPAAAPVAPAPAAPAPEEAPADSAPPPTTPHVQSQPLPDLKPSSMNGSDGARLQPAAYTAADTPVSTTSTAPAPAEPAAETPAATPPTASTPAVASAGEPVLTPRMVVHDQPARPTYETPARTPQPTAPRMATTPAPSRVTGTLASGDATVTGDVINSNGGVFENYEVQQGDHIDALARVFNTTRAVLLANNKDIQAPYVIHPGLIMKVPVAKSYVARSGDTLAGVAKRFSVNPQELADLNHISARASLQMGQEIGLPSSMRDRGPLPAYAQVTPAPRYTTPTQTVPDQHYQPSPPRYATTTQPSAPYMAPRPAPSAPQAPALSDAQITQAAHGRFIWPVRGDVLRKFGPTGVGQRNDGVDIKASQGAPVIAAAGGQVVYAGDQVKGGYGNLVLIEHDDGWFTAYAHLDKVEVHMQDKVRQGQEVGQVGATGDTTQPELHFEIRYHASAGSKTQPVDPALALPAG